MLLRSSSTPILKSWIQSHQCNNSNSISYKDSSPDNIINHHDQLSFTLPRTNSISATDHRDPPLVKTTSTPLQRLFSSSGLDEAVVKEEDVVNRAREMGLMTVGGGGGDGSGDGGRVCCGGGGRMDGGDESGDYSSNNNNKGHGSMEAYYEKMIEANPTNPLLLGNYARFLKEVRGDLGKAEEYCGRAILGSPRDAHMLSLYADIIWQSQRDALRAQTYFDQALKSAPHDCYVLASYAKFLWDLEEEEEGEHEHEYEHETNGSAPSQPHYWEETPHRSPLTAA